MAFLPIATALAPSILSGVESIFGNNSAKASANQATAASTADTAEQSALDSQLMSQYDTLMSNYDSYDQPLLDPTATTLGQVYNESEPAQLSGFANAEDYLSNPNATLSGASGTGGYTMEQLYNESQQGLDPAYSSYLENNLQDQGLQQINQIAQLGLPNPTGAAGDVAMTSLGAEANLDAQLAAQNQQVKNTALGALQTTAGGIDQQTLSNLLQGYQLAAGQNTANETFIGEGQQALTAGTAGTTGIAGQYANAATTAAGNAATANASVTNPFSSLTSLLAQNPNLFSTKASVPTLPQPTMAGVGNPGTMSGTYIPLPS